MQRAVQLLNTTNFSIKQISDQLGFSINFISPAPSARCTAIRLRNIGGVMAL